MYIPLKPLFSRHKGIGVQFTDEPTGNLDTENEEKIVELLISLAHDRDFTVIMVTHNRQIAERADVRLVMKDGRMQVLSERDVSITGLAGQ